MNPNEEQKSAARIALCDCAPGAELPDAEQHSNSCLSKSKIHFEQVASLLASRERAAALHQKQELKRKVLEVVPEKEVDMQNPNGSADWEKCGFNEARHALIQFFDKEEGE